MNIYYSNEKESDIIEATKEYKQIVDDHILLKSSTKKHFEHL